MSDIEHCINCIASSVPDTDNFTFNLPPISFQPDAIIIRQITSSMLVNGALTTTPTFNIYSDIIHNNIGTIMFPYHFVTGEDSFETFLSNPQTYIKITKTLPTSIFFHLIPVSSGVSDLPTVYFVNISFDIIKYKHK